MAIRLAICSPNQDIYSETFIQAHKKIPGVEALYYYDGRIPGMLEGKGSLLSSNMRKRIQVLKSGIFWSEKVSIKKKALLKSLKRERINCVLAEYGTTGADILNVCEKLKLPLIVHFHGYDSTKKEILDKYEKKYVKVFQYAFAVVVVSKSMERKLLDLGCPQEKLIYNPYGPNDMYFDVAPDFNNKLFIGIGRFVDKKAPYYTILAFEKVLRQHPDSRLIMAGDGPLLNTCQNLVRYLGLEKQVNFPGIISPEEFSQYLQKARAYVQHSITAANGDTEGTPVAIMEASAAGLPVISTYHAGIPDIIIHEGTGLLVQEHDVDGMAQNMIKVLDDAEYSHKLGERGKIRVHENFTLTRHLNILSGIIKQAISRKQKNPGKAGIFVGPPGLEPGTY